MTSRTQTLGFLASRIRLEEKRLLAELERRSVAVAVLDPRTAIFRPLQANWPYYGVLSREISHTRNVYATTLLEHAGLPVVNCSDLIARCGDKLLTILALVAAGVPVPPCFVALTPQAALPELAEFGYPSVVKPLIGSWGYLAARLTDEDGAQGVLEHRAALPGPQHQITLVQQYIDKPDRDIKAYVIGGEVVGAIYKASSHWRTNTARGGRAAACPLDDHLVGLLTAAANAVGDGVLGIDVIEDRDGTRYVNEINHTPEFHGALEVLETDLVGRYVDYALKRLAGG
jgi:[lysine-biosynthesis-protein LysW]---L-2-aminoadipate ligase